MSEAKDGNTSQYKVPAGVDWWLHRPQRQVIIQHPAVESSLRFKGLKVFLESTGDASRDAANVTRFNWMLEDFMREREDRILGATYGKDIAKL